MKESSSGKFIHMAFQPYSGTSPFKQKFKVMATSQKNFYYGDNEGNVGQCAIQISEGKFITQSKESVSISKKAIERVHFLQISKEVLALSQGNLYLLGENPLVVRKQLMKGVTTFAVNPKNDSIAMGIGKKIQALEHRPDVDEFSQLMFAKGFELAVPKSFTEIVWNDTFFGLVYKKAYAILDHQTGAVIEFLQMNNTPYPYLSVFMEKWLAVSGDHISMYDNSGKPMPDCSINIHSTAKASAIKDIKIQNYYLLLLRETALHIYNLLDSTEVQAIEIDKNEPGRILAPDANIVLVCTETLHKKEGSVRVQGLRPVPPKEQITRLLGQTKIEEAGKVFSHNNSPTDRSYGMRKEAFNVEAGWQLFKELRFSEAFDFFGSVNYDPREFLALIPDLLGEHKKCQTLRELNKTGSESVFKEGVRIIIDLIGYKRNYLMSSFNIENDGKKKMEFMYPNTTVNEELKQSTATLNELMEIIDNSLIKLYVQEKDIRQLQNFFESTKMLKCNYKEMIAYLKEQAKTDKTSKANICLAFLYSRDGSYINALEVWRDLGKQGIKELRDLACEEIINILFNDISDKKILFEHAKMVLLVNPDKGLKIFTQNTNLHKSITKDEIIEYLEKIDALGTQLKENYLEYLVSNKEEDESFTNLLALHYIEMIADAIKAENKKTIEIVVNPIVPKYREKFNKLLKTPKNYDASRILKAVEGIGMIDEEILLHSKQGMHTKALAKLIEMGKSNIDFGRAERYCLDQSDNLLADLFKELMRLRSEAKANVARKEKAKNEDKKSADELEKELESTKQYAAELEHYCRDFLKKYASNEKMNAKDTFSIIPDDWKLTEESEEQDDPSLLQYLELTFNSRIEKVNNLKVGKRAAEMYKLNLEANLTKLQKAHLTVTPERICKGCGKSLGGAKSFYVFPNGILIHSSCIKDLNICPVTNINFLNKIYQ